MNKTLKQILQLFLTVVFLLWGIYIRKNGGSPLLVFGTILLGIFVFVLLLLPFIFKKRKNDAMLLKKRKEALAEFIRAAEKIKMNAEECEVLSGYDKIVDDGEIPAPLLRGDGGTYMALAFLPEEAPQPDVHVESCILAFRTTYKGQEKRFTSQRIYKNRQTLEFLIANQKTIDLYVDKNDPGKYWFDLRFLEN